MQLVKYPAPSLLEASIPVEINGELQTWIDEVRSFMEEIPATLGILVGLAAPQVGRNIRVFYAMGEWYINPEIYWKSRAICPMHEGCYSLTEKKFDYLVDRSPSIRIKWQDRKGEWHDERFNGFKAQVLQHEFDHLDGILCNSGESMQ